MSLSATPRHELPFIAAGQAQKHVTHNEALLDIDTHLHLHLEALQADAPPPLPVPGQAYGLSANPGGAWSGRGGTVAVFQAEGWRHLVPRAGWRASVGAGAVLHVHDGTGWVPAAAREFAMTGRLGVGAAADAANPVLMRGNGMLLDAGTEPGPDSGDVRLRLNRAGPTDVCSVVLQTGYSGRAEIGLSSANALEVRVSPDGQAFSTALAISPQDAVARFPTRPAFRARRNGADVVVGSPGAVLPWNEATIDIGQGFDAATGRFVAPVAGAYLLMATVFAETPGQRTIVDLVRDGTVPLARAERGDVGGGFDHLSLHCVAVLPAGAFVDLRLVAGSVRITAGHFTAFSGAFLG